MFRPIKFSSRKNLNRDLTYSSKWNYLLYTEFRYYDILLKSLIFKGRKLWAFKFLIQLRLNIKQREELNPFWIIITGLVKVSPDFILFSKRLGAVVHKVPLPIRERKQYTFAIKFVVKMVKDKFPRLQPFLVGEMVRWSTLHDGGQSMDMKIRMYEEGIKNRHLLKFFKL
jgi:ribosomal protein S7